MPPTRGMPTLTGPDPDVVLDRVLAAAVGFVRGFQPATREKWDGGRYVNMAETVVNGMAGHLGVFHASFTFPETGIAETPPPPVDPDDPFTDAFWAWKVATRASHEFDQAAKAGLRKLLMLESKGGGPTYRGVTEQGVRALLELEEDERTRDESEGSAGSNGTADAGGMVYIGDSGPPPRADPERAVDLVIERVCYLLYESHRPPQPVHRQAAVLKSLWKS